MSNNILFAKRFMKMKMKTDTSVGVCVKETFLWFDQDKTEAKPISKDKKPNKEKVSRDFSGGFGHVRCVYLFVCVC